MGSNSKRKALSSEESRRGGGSGRRVKTKTSSRSGLRRQEDASRAAQTAQVTASTAKHVDEQRQDSGPVGVSRRSPPDLRKRKDNRTLGALKSSEGKVRDVIELVLWEEGRPLAAPAIAKLALERGYMTRSTMTPEATIRSTMSRELKLPASEAKFFKTVTGEYAMKEWGTGGGLANNDADNDGADVETDDAAIDEMVKIRRIVQSSADAAKKRGGRKRGAGGWSDGELASLVAVSTQEDGLFVGVTQKTLKTRRAASGVLINGKMVQSISGVPDKFLLDMASLPLDKRPKRCGQCGSCQNLHRKKACEVMRALGTNPPIPRGSNREKLLGTANSKKHVPRSFGTADGEAPDVTKLQHRGDEDEFSVEELERLKQALVETHPNMNGYWGRIAIKVRTKGEQACFQRVYQSDAYYKHAHSSKHGATANGNANGNGNGNGARRRASGEAGAGSDIGRLLEQRFGERAAAAGRNGDAVDAGVDVNAGVDHMRVRDLVEQELLDEGGDEGETTEDDSCEF